jgi:addiction module HigA family antidote
MSKHKVIGSKGNDLETNVLLHPGEVLGEELESRGILQKDFAKLLDLRPSHLNELIKGKRHVSALIALKLEKHLGIDASFWMRLQVDYDLKQARKQLKVA